jgi:peptidoglycan/xylan/chitin deacetylase (PgdA/CDA1 family)
MHLPVSFLVVVSLFPNPTLGHSAEEIEWPKNTRTAVSLSYDDALNSQLEHAVPALDKYDIQASFYLIAAADPLRERMGEWRDLAAGGHELGNHTIYHACSGSLPDRDWVSEDNDLDSRSIEQMRSEVLAANTFLQALDGLQERTFTPPCDDLMVKDGNYLAAVSQYFVAIKGQSNGMREGTSPLYMPAGESGQELIDYVKKNTKDGMLLNILFHGVGGDFLSVSAEAHEELLRFLADNRDIYWTDTYINIMRYVNEQL